MVAGEVTAGLRGAFLAALEPRLRAVWNGRADLGERLARCLTDASRAWPTVKLGAEAFAAHVAARIAERDDPEVALDDVRTSDLYLALACARGDAQAIAAFEREYLPEVDAAAHIVRASADLASECKQLLRRQLLVSEGQRVAALASFRGQADLRGWLRVAAVRELVRLRAKQDRDTPIDDETLISALSPALDPELGYIREIYRDEASAALDGALRALPSRDRSLLRYQLVEGLTLDEIATLHGTSRATVIRHLAAARRSVLERTRADLQERLGAGVSEVESVLRLVRSRLDVVLESALATRDG